MYRAAFRAQLVGVSLLSFVNAVPSDSLVAIPGTVVAQSADPATQFLGSPSLEILPNGTYVAIHDTYGSGSKEVVYQSTNRGATWMEAAEFPGQWSNLFYDGGYLYAMGTFGQNGAIVIRRSGDGGLTWTNPTAASSGLLRPGFYHTAPVPMAIHNGRIWRGFEDVGGGNTWPQMFRAFLISAPIGSDLLNAASWTTTPVLASSSTWLGGKFNGWLEGNVVVTPDGRLAEVLRADTKAGIPEQAAIIDFGTDGSAGTFDPAGRPAENGADRSGFVPLPGGAKKFTIRRDPVTGYYWSLVNTVLPPWQGTDPLYIRNVISLVRSSNLSDWETRCHLLFHPDTACHAFQYLDWQIDENDLVAVSRTAWQGRNYHDANFVTFHRIGNFRSLTMADSVPTDGSQRWPFSRCEVSGSLFTPALLGNGALAFTNRSYVWDEVPATFANSMITKVSGGVAAMISVRAKEATQVHIAVGINPSNGGLPGWTPTGDSFCYTDAGRSRMWIYRKNLIVGQEVPLPQTTWSGTLVIAPPTSSPAAWWRCESTYGNTAVADELFAFHGKPSAPWGPMAIGLGRFGSALRFYPGQHVELGNVFPLTKASFTISMWLRLDEGDTTNGVPLSRMAEGSLNGYLFEVSPAGSPGKVSFLATSTASRLTSETEVNDDRWHHVAVTLTQGGDQILYVDGIEEARCPSVEILPTSAALRFAARTVNNAPSSSFSGWLDEIEIYHKSLPQSRIQSLFSEQPTGAAPPSIAVPVTGMVISDERAKINWIAVPGQTYNVYRSHTLAPGSWELLEVLSPQSELGQFMEPIQPGGKAFFRIEGQP